MDTANRNSLASLSDRVQGVIRANAAMLREGGVMGRVRVSWRAHWGYVLVRVDVQQSYGDSIAQDARRCRSRLESAFARAGLAYENLDGDIHIYPAMSAAA